mgnify:CR=1 FL=1
MAWTPIPDKSTGDLMDETWYDAHFKANLEYLKALTDDLAGEVVVIPMLAGAWSAAAGASAVLQTGATADEVVNGSQFSADPDDLDDAEVYFETVAKGDGSSTATATLYVNGTAVTTPTTSVISTNASAYTRVRSGNLAASLPAGGSPVTFDARVKKTGGTWVYFAAIRLIIAPTG